MIKITDNTPFLYVATACTTEELYVTLDDQPYDVDKEAESSWFWQREYLIYTYEAFIDISHSTVLEFTYGNLQHTWTIEFSGE